MDEFQSKLGALVEAVKPAIYVETGFMNGDSAKAVIASMNKIGHGAAYSIEPTTNPTFEDARFHFVRGLSYQKMEELFLQVGAWDMFLHDSDHCTGCMTYELELAWHYVKSGGYIVSDDYTWGTPEHNAWPNFVKRHGATVHQLGSCQYIIKPTTESMPVQEKTWAHDKWIEATKLSNAASSAYGDKKIFCDVLPMKTFCLTLYETPERTEACKKHFAERGIDAEFVYGYHAGTCGLRTENNYEVDNPGGGFNIGKHGVGIWTSFIMLYQIMNQFPDEHFFVLEHDVNFDENWRARFDQAIKDVPPDFDFLYIGSCCVKDLAFKRHIKGEIYEVKYPYCNHAIVIAKKCLPFVIQTLLKKCWSPFDIQLASEVFPSLNVYTVIPRMATQFDKVINE